VPIPVVRLLIALDGSNRYVVECLYRKVAEGVYCDDADLVPILVSLSPSSNMKFCPGILGYEAQFKDVRFNSKNVRKWDVPCNRIDSQACKLWYQLPHNAPREQRSDNCVQCKECSQLQRDLTILQSRAARRSESEKQQRVSASSTIPLKFLSPHSQSKKLLNVQHEKQQMKNECSRLQHQVTLSHSQSTELADVCNMIHDNHMKDLDEVVAGVTGAENQDVTSKRTFERDQQENTTGDRGNRWSMLTYRIALAVFSRSRSAYEALRSFKILQLPSIRSLQHFTGANNDKPGWCEDSILSQRERYDQFCKKCEEDGKKKPVSDGILIMDEVKVISKVLWNSSSEEIYGLSMSDSDLAGLHDVFQNSESTNTARTSYVLQFVWRDMSCSFDVLGPYYTSAKPLDSKASMVCLYDCIRLLHVYNFVSSGLVCDGASVNLSLIKSMIGVRGSFGMQSGVPDSHRIQAFAEHPILPDRKLHFIICPSHQLKNMCNALFASSPGRGKAFVSENGISFGWRAIVDMYERECQRQRDGIPRDIPGLRKNFVSRDPWTKLNVLPAKIMQQEKVITELQTYCTTHPSDEDNVQAAINFLKACSQLFETGTLSHEKITAADSPPLVSLVNGYKFFEKWLDALLASDPQFVPTNPNQKKFLSWQTWDLLRLVRYGMVSFCEEYIQRHQGYYIVPVRISGSAVETLFSQMKHAGGGRLSATNYRSSRASVLTQRSIHTWHSSGKDYRDAALDFSGTPMRRKS